MSDLTAERARELLDYDPETGVVRWNVTRSRLAKAGCVAGSVGTHGYLLIVVDQKKYQLHRVAWLIAYGEWPDQWLDHMNGNRLDNRLSNLRLATPGQNMFNTRKPSTNKSGFKGVSYCTFTGRWRASISFEGRARNLGRFNCPTVAHLAYRKAALDHFGEYARFD